jgi:hypothetical protein
MSAPASVVVTQIESRSFFSLWLFSTHIQQNIAHAQIINNHDVTAVPEFTARALDGVEIVYLSPSLDELRLATAEIDVLVAFVESGGRLIVSADNGDWANEFRALAARFDVTYGTTFINGVWQADVQDFDNPITNGPAGRVEVYSGASHNNDLNSTNPNFRVLATWQSGPSSLGYLRHGAGEVVFLSDFNTWDTDMFFDFDNQVLWANLFEAPACAGFVCGDAGCDGTFNGADIDPFFQALGDPAAWQAAHPGCDLLCVADINGDGAVNGGDIDTFFAALAAGGCP